MADDAATVELASAGVRAAGLTDRGMVRTANEDCFALVEDLPILVVSDGVGGGPAGSTASRIVCSVLPEILRDRLSAFANKAADHVKLAMREAIVELSSRMRERGKELPGLAGMGATAVTAYLAHGRLHLANMGDSRAYRLRGETFAQLTEDHTVANALLQAGQMTQAEARSHPSRCILSRYVGMKGVVYPDVDSSRLRLGDRMLLCSDGLTSMVDDAAIADLLRRATSPSEACVRLVEAANRAGGGDNITVVVADWIGTRARKRSKSAEI